MSFKALARIIKVEMENQGLNQKNLANRSGLRESIISKFLNTDKDASWSSIRKMFMGLGKTPVHLIETSDCCDELISVPIDMRLVDFVWLQYLTEKHHEFKGKELYELLKEYSLNSLLKEANEIDQQEENMGLFRRFMEKVNKFPTSSIFIVFGLKSSINFDRQVAQEIKWFIEKNGSVYIIILSMDSEVEKLDELVAIYHNIGATVFVNNYDKHNWTFFLNPEAVFEFRGGIGNGNDLGDLKYDKRIIRGDLKFFLKLLKLNRTKDDHSMKAKAIERIHSYLSSLGEFHESDLKGLIPEVFVDSYIRCFTSEQKETCITSYLNAEYHDRNIDFLKKQSSGGYCVDKFIKRGGKVQLIYFSEKDFASLSKDERAILSNYLIGNPDKHSSISIYYAQVDSFPRPLFTVVTDGVPFGVEEEIDGENVIVAYERFDQPADIDELKVRFEELKRKAIRLYLDETGELTRINKITS